MPGRTLVRCPIRLVSPIGLVRVAELQQAAANQRAEKALAQATWVAIQQSGQLNPGEPVLLAEGQNELLHSGRRHALLTTSGCGYRP